MATKQPEWRYIHRFGDVNVTEGASYLRVDTLGVYCPELVVFEPLGDGRIRRSVILVERCNMVNLNFGTLSDNNYHTQFPTWFASSFKAMCNTQGIEPSDAAKKLCGADPVERASVYLDMANYHGIANFDHDPDFVTVKEAKAFDKLTKL